MIQSPMEPEIAWKTRDKISGLEKKLHKAMAKALKPLIFDKNKFFYVQIYDRDIFQSIYCRDDMVFRRYDKNRFSVELRDVKTGKKHWYKYETPEHIWRAIKDRLDYARAFYSSI